MITKLKEIFGQKESLKILLSSMLTMASLGVVYTWSVFIIPLETEFGWARNQISFIFTVSIFFFSTGIGFGGFLNRRLALKKLILLEIVILAFSFTMASFSQNLTNMIFFYGFLCGLFMGIMYNTLIYLCNLWFDKEHAATVSGFLQTCLAASTVLLSYFAAGLLEYYDWRVVFRVMGCIIAVSFLVALKVLRAPQVTVSVSGNPTSSSHVALTGINWQRMLRTTTFWLFWFIRMITLAGGIGMLGHAVPVALEAGASYSNAILALGLVSFCNALGRTLFGAIWDYAGLRKTCSINGLFFIASFVLLFFVSLYPNQLVTLLAFGLCGFSYGGTNIIGVSFTREVFGMKYFSENYGLSTSATMCSTFVGPYLMGEVRQVTGSYEYSFLLFIGLGIFVWLLLLLMPKVSYATEE